MAPSKTQVTPPDAPGELEPEAVSLEPSAALGQDRQAMLDTERRCSVAGWPPSSTTCGRWILRRIWSCLAFFSQPSRLPLTCRRAERLV